MSQLRMNNPYLSFAAPLAGIALAVIASTALGGCAEYGSPAQSQIGSEVEEIIGGSPARGARFRAFGALGVPVELLTNASTNARPLATYRGPYIEPRRLAPSDTHVPICSATLIAPGAVLTAEHCLGFEGLEFLIGFDGANPTRTVPIIGALAETRVFGGFVGQGSDLAVAFLAQEVTDIEPVEWSALSNDDIGQPFVGIGYGVRNNLSDAGHRYMGVMNLRGIGGNHAENVFGSYENFLNRYSELSWSLTPEEAFADFVLLDEYEASFGYAPGNAQACFGDSGGPVVRERGGKLTTYGVVSGGVGSVDLSCDWGAVYSVFGPLAADFIERSLACPMIAERGVCRGNVAVHCAPREQPSGYHPIETDCSQRGRICGKDATGMMSCIADPCAGIPKDGTCRGHVAVRCSLPDEGPRRVIETDCALLGATCGTDATGTLTCVSVP